MTFKTERDLAVCGLACVLCSNEDCPGCKARGKQEGCDCTVYRCAEAKGLDGCYQCDEFPCGEDMLKGTRNRAFNRYASAYGKEALLERLCINHENGITYHKPDGFKGDYDALSSQEDIQNLIHYGTHDPYAVCPVLSSTRFTLRLVAMADAQDLLACYSDPKSQPIFNADNCTSDFRYSTIEDMTQCLSFFMYCYENKGFVRFAAVDKETRHAVGTVELFNAAGPDKPKAANGILRLDLASPYETEDNIKELISLCLPPFSDLFGVSLAITKAIPEANARIAALKSLGFKPYTWPEQTREHYWAKDIGGKE